MTHVNQPNLFLAISIHHHSIQKKTVPSKIQSTISIQFQLKICKSIYDIISQCLTGIINISLKRSIFPDNIKKARVTPIRKEGNKDNLKYYKPRSNYFLNQ